MGIPSYFSYIIKNHSRIISNHDGLRREGIQFNSLLMDCNSIVYDAVRTMEGVGETSVPYKHHAKVDYEAEIISRVISRIREIIHSVQPSDFVYVTFDGVAPFAKMEQQRTRRYKSSYMSTLDFENNTRSTGSAFLPKSWNTASITPGTAFMETLSATIKTAFASSPEIIVSAADQAGEGEHKMFAHLRNLPTQQIKNSNVAVYGLDSDLIMLSIFHKPYVRNIYIFREAPSFSKSVLPRNLQIQPNEPLFLNTHKLTQSILQEMGCTVYNLGRVYDYVFICFLLGNDFLPHFLALNLRTNGLHILLEHYAHHFAKYPNRGFIDPVSLNIQWNWVHFFLQALAKTEHDTIVTEYRNRAQLHKQYPTATAKDRETILENAPVILRAQEEYISPEYMGWEHRYYQTALHCEYTPENALNVCTNYLEGLEWVFQYYTRGCPHWRWSYKYHYPPLLKDLARATAKLGAGHSFFASWGDGITNAPFSPKVQLAYVIPKMQFELLPPHVRELVLRDADDYPEIDTLEFTWIGCRYFWEAHVLLPEIPLNKLEYWENQIGDKNIKECIEV